MARTTAAASAPSFGSPLLRLPVSLLEDRVVLEDVATVTPVAKGVGDVAGLGGVAEA